MMENYSLADMKAALGEGGTNTSNFGGGMLLIIVLFLFIFMGWGGGWGGNSRDNALTESGFCTGMNFNNLENNVARTETAMQQGFTNLGNGICNLGYEQSNNSWAARYDSLQNTNTLQQAISDCCCTQRAQGYENQIQGIQNTQAVLDAICSLKSDMKDEKIASLQAQVNNLEMNSAIGAATAGTIKFPSSFAYNAGPGPFNGGMNCGCSCNF
jgi:hypothetical protein